jgi:periplasmic divalent cation tolerance protein
MKPVIIYSTTGSREEAQKIGNDLVKNKLAACVNIIPNIESIYNWQNELHQDLEFLLMIKTDAKFKNDIQNIFEKTHSYDLPELIMVNIQDSSTAYLRWMQDKIGT